MRIGRLGRAGFAVLARIQEILTRRRVAAAVAPDGDIVLVSVVKNEELRLPFFLKYYGDLGIRQFVFLDHESSDRSGELIDGCRFATQVPVSGDFVFKRTWIRAVLNTVCRDRWVLVVDADEILVYPGMESLSLVDLVATLQRGDHNALPCLLLDMYPRGDVFAADYRASQDPLQVAPYFDPDGRTRSLHLGVEPKLTKVPLFRYRGDLTLAAGQHSLAGSVRTPDSSGVLLHFKFMQDFASQLDPPSRLLTFIDAQYAAELAAYREVVSNRKPLVLHSDRSLRFESTQQLCALGLMHPGKALGDPAVELSTSTPVR